MAKLSPLGRNLMSTTISLLMKKSKNHLKTFSAPRLDYLCAVISFGGEYVLLWANDMAEITPQHHCHYPVLGLPLYLPSKDPTRHYLKTVHKLWCLPCLLGAYVQKFCDPSHLHAK